MVSVSLFIPKCSILEHPKHVTNHSLDIYEEEHFYQNLSNVISNNIIYVLTGKEIKEVSRVSRSDLRSNLSVVCSLQNENSFVEHEVLTNRKDLTGVHLKIGYISVKNFIHCHNNVSILEMIYDDDECLLNFNEQ